MAQVDPEQSSIKDLLDKTIFLIALAPCGRISEISVLRRGPDFLCVSSTGLLILSPGPDFLAKNEDPSNRHKPWRISPISGDDSSLCPVATTQAYLKRTADFAAGSLFRHHVSGKPLSLSGTRCCLTSLIKRFNPESIPKTHDIRKMASSLAFFEGMAFPDISTMTGWSTPNVFIRHYLHKIKLVMRACVVLGKAWEPARVSSA